MCGIAGVVAWDEKYRVTRDVLQRMSNAIAHRGPDGEGFYLNHEREITPDNPQVGFVFRRLAVIDPDPRSMQPFTIGHLTLVYNGEIYNYRELRSEISKLRPDYQWRTQGDAEVLLMSYDVWREKCVEHLNGMFAIAVWDDREKSLYLATDRMGQKPLFWAHKEGGGHLATCFGSEIGSLVCLPWVGRQIDVRRLRGYLRWGYFEDNLTPYAEINKLHPGGLYIRSRARFDGPRSYFSPNERSKESPIDDPARETRRLVVQAVERQLVADVPLGCFLSGGADSSVIAAAMRAARAKVLSFSIGFDDRRYDETSYGAAVAKHLGTIHQQFIVHPNAAEDLPKLAAIFGEPFADSSALPTHYLSRETRRHVKVALSGDGGDELFGGYDRYRAMVISERVRNLPRPVRALVRAKAWQRMPGTHPKAMTTRVKRFLATAGESAANRYTSYLRIFDETLIVALFQEELRDNHEINMDQLGNPQDGLTLDYAFWYYDRDLVQAALALDRTTYLPGDLLTKVDRCSMLHGLEVRSPFMDHELVQFAAGLTTDQLLKGGPKRMLREAFAKDLPDFVFKRKKMGFAVPIGEWFRGPLRAMLHDNLFASDSFAKQHFNMKVVERLVEEHETERVDHSQRLYALLMLELWWRWHRAA